MSADWYEITVQSTASKNCDCGKITATLIPLANGKHLIELSVGKRASILLTEQDLSVLWQSIMEKVQP